MALLKSTQRSKYEHFSNNADGFGQLSQWLDQQGVAEVHGCLEATRIYGHALALYLHQQGHQVSIVNPLRVKGYSESQLSRTKSDRADAKLIAQFCRDLKPSPWQPSAVEVSQLQGYTRRLDALGHMLTEEKNRLQVSPADFKAD
ncbi:MAG: transposase [Leptolyngbyaceae cyanobacterium]